jgi:hypothetical protein
MKNLALWITAPALIGGVVAVASGIGNEGRMPDLDGPRSCRNRVPGPIVLHWRRFPAPLPRGQPFRPACV